MKVQVHCLLVRTNDENSRLDESGMCPLARRVEAVFKATSRDREGMVAVVKTLTDDSRFRGMSCS